MRILYYISNDVFTIRHIVIVGIAFLYSFENIHSLFNGGFFDIYLLKATHQALVLCQIAVKLFVSGGANNAYRAFSKIGFKYV